MNRRPSYSGSRPVVIRRTLWVILLTSDGSPATAGMAARRTPTSQNGVVAALKFVFTGTRTLGGIAQTLAECDEGAEGLDPPGS